MIAAILGYPHAGKRTLCASVQEIVPDASAITFATIRALLTTSTTAAAKAARARSDAGKAVPDELFGQLLAEAVASSHQAHTLLVALPRNAVELATLQAIESRAIHIIHLRASPQLIDQRRLASSLPPVEQSHPGGLSRIDEQLVPLVADATANGHFLDLDADLDVKRLALLTAAFLGRG